MPRPLSAGTTSINYPDWVSGSPSPRAFFHRVGTPFQAISFGTLKRQLATAEPLRSCLRPDGPAPELAILPEFNEYDSSAVIQSQIPHLLREDPFLEQELPRLQTDRRVLQRILDRSLSRWMAESEEAGGLETWAAFNRRVQEGIARILSESGPGKTVALVTSGGPLSAIFKNGIVPVGPENPFNCPGRFETPPSPRSNITGIV